MSTDERDEETKERDLHALEALFFWGLADREKSKKWQKRGDAAASRAMAAEERRKQKHG